jgi:hypothetical protein
MADVKKIISDLKTSFGGSNEEQMKAVQLLKGLATSDEPEANEFMKALDKSTTQIATSMTESVIEITEDITIPGTDIVLEKGDRIEVISEVTLPPWSMPWDSLVSEVRTQAGDKRLLDKILEDFEGDPSMRILLEDMHRKVVFR